MNIDLTSHYRRPLATLLGVLTAAMLISSLAAAQDTAKPVRDAAVADQDVLTAIGLWFDRQVDALKATFSNAHERFDNFGHEAGVAARATVNGAKDAAHAVARLPNARVVSGYAKCRNAANGAPDCVTAADAVCKAKGFNSGKSVDMTTAEVCPPKVWMAGRNEGAGCHTETFVSSALCH